MTENKTNIQADEDREEEQSGGLQQNECDRDSLCRNNDAFCFVSTGLVVV